MMECVGLGLLISTAIYSSSTIADWKREKEMRRSHSSAWGSEEENRLI